VHSRFVSRFYSGGFNSATSTLKLNHYHTAKELRDAYFTAAKLCHPDLNKTKSEEELTDRFLKITEAYEFLQQKDFLKRENDEDEMDMSNIVSKSEEQRYRDACMECLGLDAETVEESKKCVLFRHWLKGKTDATFTWNRFFMSHGGLAPMLRKRKHLSIGMGELNSARRRKRGSGRVRLQR